MVFPFGFPFPGFRVQPVHDVCQGCPPWPVLRISFLPLLRIGRVPPIYVCGWVFCDPSWQRVRSVPALPCEGQ